jgi:flavodoxin
MRATVVYKSLFGSTREVAEAVAEGLRAAPGAAVDCWPVVDAGPALG